MDEKRNKIYKKIEIVLVIIVVLLIVALIGLYLFNNEMRTIDREYSYNAYKVTTTNNSMTVTTYYETGDRIKDAETYYFENGKITKIVNEYYYSNIYMTKFWYNSEIKQKEESGQEDVYTITRKGNAIVHTNNNIDFAPIDISNKEEVDIYNTYIGFTTNEQIIKYCLDNVDGMYKDNYKRVY